MSCWKCPAVPGKPAHVRVPISENNPQYGIQHKNLCTEGQDNKKLPISLFQFMLTGNNALTAIY